MSSGKRRKEYVLLESIRSGRPMSWRQRLELIVRLSVPSMLAQLSSIVMLYIDASMVGSLGAEASASIGLVSTTTWLFNGKFTTDGPEQNDRQTNSYACSTPLDLAAIDFDYLQKIGEKADALVMSDEEGKKLTLKSAGMFRFRVWPVSLSNVDRWNRSEEYRAESQQMQVQFELNYVDESESPEYQGRFTVTNYYTVAFTADAAGEVAIDD